MKAFINSNTANISIGKDEESSEPEVDEKIKKYFEPLLSDSSDSDDEKRPEDGPNLKILTDGLFLTK